MKAREFERQVRGWLRGFGHDWVVRAPPPDAFWASDLPNLPRMGRHIECRRCRSKICVQRDERLVNIIVPAAVYPLFGRVIEWKRRPGHPAGPRVRDSRVPRMFRGMSSACREM